MITISRRIVGRSLSAFCLVTGSACLLLSGCGGGSSNNTGGGGGGGGGSTTYTLTVDSTNPTSGVSIGYTNSVTQVGTSGTTPFTVASVTSGTSMILTAPATAGGNNFSSWSGCTSTSGGTCNVTVSGNITVTANYSTPVAPTVTVTPSSASITTAQTLSVTVAVAAAAGSATPTGSVVLTSGSYTSAATTLTSGSATISVPAGSLATGTDSLKATYTPDSASSTAYTTSSGTGSVTVNPLSAPTVTVTPASATITTAQTLSVTIGVAAAAGGATPTGSVVLTSGSYTSASTALSSGSATISVPAGSLATGTDSLKAAYTPDSASSTTYTTSSGTASVTVLAAPAVTVTPSSASITTAQTLSVTIGVAASPGGATPTGSVVLTSGSYTSASTTLSNGSATINIPAGSLATGTDTLKVVYTPDSASSTTYTTSSGTGSVTVNLPPPAMSLGLSLSSITTTQSITVTFSATGSPTPTGSVVLSSGSYKSASTPLSAGVAIITIPAGSLAAGNDTLTATYTPDSASSSTYGPGTTTAPVTVSYAVTVASSNPGSGVSITVSPKDVNGNASGSTPISLAYSPNTTVTLTASTTTATGNTFNSWTGCSSTSGATCTLNVTAPATVTANYASVSVSPSGNVTIGQSQQFTASVTGLTPGTVTWSVAIASGTGSAGTISSTGLYQTPYPAPTSVTVTATSTANTSIKGTVTVTLAAPATAAGPALSVDAGTVTNAISPLVYGMNAYLLDSATVQNANITVARWGGDDTSRYNYQTNVVNSANDYYFENFTGSSGMLSSIAPAASTGLFNDFMTTANALDISTIGTAPVIGWVSNSTVQACSFPKSTYPNQASYNGDNCGNGVELQGNQIPNTTPATTCTNSAGCSFPGSSTTWQTTSITDTPPTAPGTGNNTSTWSADTWIGGWIDCLMTKNTYCASGPGKDATIWDLDNEPEYWSAVHRDVHPNPMTYDEITNGGIGTALAIKAADPSAQVSGPIISGWYQYFYSQQDVNNGYSASPCYQPWGNPTDRTAHGGVPLIEYYIQQMSSASDTYSVRLLDYVDIHAYYAAIYNGTSVAFTTAGDTGEQQARMNSTRSFWDPTYTDPNNTGLYQPVYPPTYPTGTTQNSAVCKTPASPDLIPMMQQWASTDWTSTKFPQRLKTSIDEYNFGATESINGAVTQADVLGIFGKYGLDMGVFWPTSGYSGQIPGNMAFEIYRNYDGNKSTFGDQELSSSTGDQSKLAVYAASRTSDGAVTIVVINKTYGSLTDTLSINNLTSTATSAQVFQYSNANLNAIVGQPAATITPPVSPSTISTIAGLSFPGQSITMIVVPSH